MNPVLIRATAFRQLNTFNSMRLQRHLAVAKPQIETAVFDHVECEYRSNQWRASLPLGPGHSDARGLDLAIEDNRIQVRLQRQGHLAPAEKTIRLPDEAIVDSVRARVVDEQLIICVQLHDEFPDDTLVVPITGLSL